MVGFGGGYGGVWKTTDAGKLEKYSPNGFF